MPVQSRELRVGINPLQACQAGSRCDPARPARGPDSWLQSHTPKQAGRCRGQRRWAGRGSPPHTSLSDCVCVWGGRGGAASTYSGVSLLLGCQVVHDDEFLQVVLDGGLVVLPGRAEVSEGGPQPRLPKDVFGVAVHLPGMRVMVKVRGVSGGSSCFSRLS